MPSISTLVTNAWSGSSKRVERHDANNTSKSSILAYVKTQSRLTINNAFKTANPRHYLASAKKIPQGTRVVYCRSEEHTSEIQSLMRKSYAVFCLKKKNTMKNNNTKII